MRSLPVGRHALLVVVDGPREAVAAQRLVARIAARERDLPDGLPAPVDVVPAARTVLLDGLPDLTATQGWRARLAAESATRPDERSGASGGRSVVIEVRYDGPDLDIVAGEWSCSPEAVIGRHQESEFLVAFCGFAPGFAYCTANPPLPEMPRRAEPRERVPAGSVALAGEYCGIYPAAMPGGWQLIGTTSVMLFDPAREEPALLTPGDAVRFRAVR